MITEYVHDPYMKNFRPEKYEKDIRDIVEYFERKKEKKNTASGDEVDTRYYWDLTLYQSMG